MATFEVSFGGRGFRLRRLAQSSVARIGTRGILDRFIGCPRTFLSKTSFYVTGAGDRMVLEGRNVSLRGRCKESDTSENRGRRRFVDVARTLACVCVIRRILCFAWQAQGIRTMDPLFWGRRAPFLRKVAFLELQLDDALAWPAQHFAWLRVGISWIRGT